MGVKVKSELRDRLTREKLSDSNRAIKKNRRTRGRLRKRLERLLTKRQLQNQTSKVLLHSGRVSKELRSKNEEWVKWLKDKYINKSGAKGILPEELELF